MKAWLVLPLLVIPVLAAAQYRTPQQQAIYGMNTFVIQPVQKGAQQAWNKHGVPVTNSLGVVKDMYSGGVSPALNAARFGTPIMIMINPSSGNPALRRGPHYPG